MQTPHHSEATRHAVTEPQQFPPLELFNRPTVPTKRRSDPAQWVVEVGAAFPPLELITRPTVDTAAAAHYLNRKPQTLRGWACMENGPLRPIRINGRLAWSVSGLRHILGMA